MTTSIRVLPSISIRVLPSIIGAKPLKFSATQGFNAKYGGPEIVIYIGELLAALKKRPVDMYVFSTENGLMTVKCAGYVLPENLELDETTIVSTFKSLPTDTFWCKLDELEEAWIATFLFPSEY